ncbi:hypothetical protein TELCIR_12203 [Teladorsagia circumcincta]|uniref:CC domain-containing protein n=1 Tax=Teladorsagia circumcincta TaxID=45464 RepID=A0A2G9U9D2_TELCI|nr:hypothetical protein TELCIR_12203 [Teladorsagia circumcincta]
MCHISFGGGGCPPSYTCQSDVPNAFQGYCCSQHVICPGGVNYHLDEKLQMPTTCSSEGFAFCPQKTDVLGNNLHWLTAERISHGYALQARRILALPVSSVSFQRSEINSNAADRVELHYRWAGGRMSTLAAPSISLTKAKRLRFL